MTNSFMVVLAELCWLDRTIVSSFGLSDHHERPLRVALHLHLAIHSPHRSGAARAQVG